jgi:NAD(P)-dependent dehydrogenase (short-subunit alcohol dehydrogenase family)
MKYLAGKIALVTGAGRGFGAGMARGLAQAGAQVCITDVEADELAQTAADIAADGNEALTLAVDVRDIAAMEHAVAQCVARWNRVDCLIGNAAVLPLIPFDELTPERWQRIIDINLTGVYNGARVVWSQMQQQGGGHLIAIASGASVRGSAGEVAYCAAKHALEGFSKALAIEGAPHNIAVNTVGPGKLIKPTSISRADAAHLSAAQHARWVDPVALAPAFVWLIMQPPARYTGLRFDAGPLADTIMHEGYDFTFAPEKTTLYAEDMRARLNDRSRWSTLAE